MFDSKVLNDFVLNGYLIGFIFFIFSLSSFSFFVAILWFYIFIFYFGSFGFSLISQLVNGF